MKSSNMENPFLRAARYLREWLRRYGRMVRRQVIRGAAYGVGSGSVSLLIIWFQSRLGR